MNQLIINAMEDPDQVEQDFKLSTIINMMDPEVADRFKALKVLAY